MTIEYCFFTSFQLSSSPSSMSNMESTRPGNAVLPYLLYRLGAERTCLESKVKIMQC